MPILTDLVHILDKKTDEIIGTLSLKNAEYSNAIRTDSIQNENKFDFDVNAKLEKASLLEKRNRLLIQDEDGFYKEYVIYYAEQYTRDRKTVRSNASFTDLAKAKVINPQTLTGATSLTAAQLALDGTEWQPGVIEYTSTQTLIINDYTNPLALLKQIASSFGLEIGYRVEIDGNKIVGRYIDMKQQLAGFEGKEIVFGKDLTGVKRKEESGSIVTALLVIGPQKDDGTRLTVLVEDKDALQRWGRNGQHLIEVYEPQSNDTNIDATALTSLGEIELAKRIDAIVSYECSAASLEHIFGREHEKIRLAQTVRIKDDGYNPPLYVEGRIQDVEINQATHQINSFTIGNFKEYKKSDLENQIKWLKDVLSQKASTVFVVNFAEKKKVLSNDPPTDTTVIWIKPDSNKSVNIAYAHDGTDWVPLTTTNASDIVEGEMLFDRLRGGKLILGGVNGENGLMEVVDENGETVFTMDAGIFGFDKLWVGELNSPSIPNINTTDLNFYVDPAGDDDNDGLSWSTPKQTIQACIDLIPKFNNANVVITCKSPQTGVRQDYVGNVILGGFTGSGSITIEGQDWYNYIVGNVQVMGCTNNIFIKNFTINLTTTTAGVDISNSTYVYCEKIWVYGQAGGSSFYVKYGSHVYLKNCEGYNSIYIIFCGYASTVYAETCKGSGTSRGLVAQYGGKIDVFGTYPNGTTSATYSDYGGIINLNGATVTGGSSGTTPTQQYTKQMSQNSVNSWTEYYSTWANEGSVKQGRYTSTVGNYRGLWFFGTKLLDTIGTGKTIKSMRVWISRASSSGTSGKVRHSLRAHGYATQPGSAPTMGPEIGSASLAWGEGAWINVNPAYFTSFANGTYKGVGLYTSDGSNYSKCNAACTIEITYQ